MGVKLDGHAGTERNVRISVSCNGPREETVDCVVTARCPAPFRVEPAFIQFGRVSPARLASLKANVQVTHPDGDVNSLKVRVGNGPFLALMVGPGLVQVQPAASVEYGDHYGSLELFLEGAEERLIRVPVQLQLSPPLTVVPSTLILRKDGVSQFRPMSWILVSNSSAPLGAMTAVNAPPEFQIEETGIIDDHRRRYRLTIQEEWKAPQRFELELMNSSRSERCKLVFISLDR